MRITIFSEQNIEPIAHHVVNCRSAETSISSRNEWIEHEIVQGINPDITRSVLSTTEVFRKAPRHVFPLMPPNLGEGTNTAVSIAMSVWVNPPSEARTFRDTIVTFFRFIAGQTSPLQEIQELKQEAAIAQLCHWKIVERRWCQECVSAGCLQLLSTMINCLHTRLSSVAQDDSSPAARSQHRGRHPFSRS